MPNSKPAFHAFTLKHTGLCKQLITEISVEYEGIKFSGRALWDTGATGSCISSNVVKQLSLVSTGKSNMATAAGSKVVDCYLLNFDLPNHVRINDVKVSEPDLANQGIDFLIGMDIILLGDFIISNYGGKTVFSFRFPSKQCVDYVMQINVEKKIGQKHGNGKRGK